MMEPFGMMVLCGERTYTGYLTNPSFAVIG